MAPFRVSISYILPYMLLVPPALQVPFFGPFPLAFSSWVVWSCPQSPRIRIMTLLYWIDFVYFLFYSSFRPFNEIIPLHHFNCFLTFRFKLFISTAFCTILNFKGAFFLRRSNLFLQFLKNFNFEIIFPNKLSGAHFQRWYY